VLGWGAGLLATIGIGGLLITRRART